MPISSTRLIGRFGICLLLLALAAGCGNGQREGSSASPPSSASAQPPAETVEPSGTDGASPSDGGGRPESSVPDSSGVTEDDDVNRILGTMTLEQKVGQMLLAGIDGKTLDDGMTGLIAEQHVGGIIWYKNNFSDLKGSVDLANGLKQANAGNPVPLFMSVDQEGGKVSRLPDDFAAMPDAARVGSTGDPELAKEMGALLSEQLKLVGFNVDFAPVLDVNSNPNNPVIGSRAFGSDAERVSKMGVAVMQGLQQGGTVPVVKHFPGHGDTAVDSHVDLPVVDKTTDQLRKMEWLPFRDAIDSGADAVMVAHILFPKIDPEAPASFSKIIIGEQLRGTLGFEGVVITDDMTMGAIADHYGIEDASLLSVEAGTDILLVAHGYGTAKKVYDRLLDAVRSGRLPESRIDESVRRILSLKLKYGLSDRPIDVPAPKDLPNAEIRQWLDKL